MLARHVVLLTPSKSSRPSELLSCEQISIVTRLESTLLQLLILSPFRINTYKSVSKQSTLTPFRMNTYEKHRGGGLLWLTSLSGGSVLLATEKPPTREHLFRKSRISYDSCRPARLCPSYSYTCALFCTHQELNSFVFNRFRTLYEKHPGGGVPLSPNGSRPGKRGICLVLTSLLPYIPTPPTSRNSDALPAAMGAAAERACRLQERRSSRLFCCQQKLRQGSHLPGGGAGAACSKCLIPCLPGPPCVTV